MGRRVLVTGASIAGNTLAWGLTRAGFDVTVVERAPAFRDGGQNVDVRGAAREVMARMGLAQAVADQGTGERGWSFVEEDGEVVAQFDEEVLGGNGPTAELEILRGDLARLLYDARSERTVYRFGDEVQGIDEDGDAARVTFKGGTQANFDLVVVAEGVGSSTREKVFAGEAKRRSFDLYMGYFTIPKGPGDGDVARWFNAPGGRSVFLRPDRKGTTRAVLTLQTDDAVDQDGGPEAQQAFLRERFADAGWETPRVLDGMARTDDFYFDAIAQVRMDRWSKGRVVLTGDAAWCATPLSGMGATLAIVGGHVLAGELARTDDVAAAFSEYERLMRPYVDKAQGVPKFAPKLAQPQSRLGIAVQRTLLGVAAAPGIRQVSKLLFSPPADEFELPDYRFGDDR